MEVTKQKSYRGHFVQSNDVDFISPIDGSRIRSRQQLVDHNKQHGVSNDLDSLREQSARSREPKTLSSRERKNGIADAYERASSSGFHRHIQYED